MCPIGILASFLTCFEITVALIVDFQRPRVRISIISFYERIYRRIYLD